MRDFAGEILQLHESKDAQGLARLAMELLAIANITLVRRQRDAAKKGVRRHTPSPQNPQTSAESADTNLRISTTTTKDISVGIVRKAVCPQTATLLQRHCGEAWPDIEAFLLRREETKELGWAKEMLRLTTGTQFGIEELAQVCRDDAALDRAIGSPFALRRFIQNAKHERSGAMNGSGTNHSTGEDVFDRWARDEAAKDAAKGIV